MDIPKEITYKPCDAERFTIGLRQLAQECNLAEIDYNGSGVIMYYFKDGSKIDGWRAQRDAGIIKC